MAKVAVVGTGNLAWHLAPNLARIGLEVEVWSREEGELKLNENSNLNKQPVPLWGGGELKPYPQKIVTGQELVAIFLAVPDDFIASTSQQLALFVASDVPIIHTSGASSTLLINDYFEQRGALWPIRSLRKGEIVPDWHDLPLVYYSAQNALKEQLGIWAEQLSEQTYYLNNEQRAHLHLAAVFSNNFTTWLCQIAYELCQENEIPFAALVPIIKNTFSQMDGSEPALRQTGAAIRGDQKTMDRHVELLKEQEEYRELYLKISSLIAGHSKK